MFTSVSGISTASLFACLKLTCMSSSCMPHTFSVGSECAMFSTTIHCAWFSHFMFLHIKCSTEVICWFNLNQNRWLVFFLHAPHIFGGLRMCYVFHSNSQCLVFSFYVTTHKMFRPKLFLGSTRARNIRVTLCTLSILASSIIPPPLLLQSWIFLDLLLRVCLWISVFLYAVCAGSVPLACILTYYPPWVLGVFHACRRVPGTLRRGNLVTLANRRPHRGVEFMVTNSTGYFEASSCP